MIKITLSLDAYEALAYVSLVLDLAMFYQAHHLWLLAQYLLGVPTLTKHSHIFQSILMAFPFLLSILTDDLLLPSPLVALSINYDEASLILFALPSDIIFSLAMAIILPLNAPSY